MRWAVLALMLQTSPPGTLHPALAQPGKPIPLTVGGTIAPAVPLYDGPWTTTAPLLKIAPDPIMAVTLVPTEKGWLLVAGGRTYSAQGELTCTENPPRKIIVVREGHPSLTVSLECPGAPK